MCLPPALSPIDSPTDFPTGAHRTQTLKLARIAVPDLVSNSYFPAIAAIELGFFEQEGLDIRHELIFPNYKTYEALRDGGIDFVAGPAHAALPAFPGWKGAKLLAALAQGLFWLLVMRADSDASPGDVAAVKGKTIGAAPLVDLTLRHLLAEAGIDLEANDIKIVGVPGTHEPGVSFGVAAARALEAGVIDGFWANGMGAENAVRSGIGKVVLDVRRGIGPAPAFHYTVPALVTSDRVLARDPELAAAAVRAIVRTQQALKADISLATRVGQRFFPAAEAALIADVVARDLPYYEAGISEQTVAGLNGFAIAAGLLDAPVTYADLVAGQMRRYWEPDPAH
jgi:ABC-type nitrate/sulfonate/bicarbonate transport system substrate-binding protein